MKLPLLAKIGLWLMAVPLAALFCVALLGTAHMAFVNTEGSPGDFDIAMIEYAVFALWCTAPGLVTFLIGVTRE